MGRHQRRAARRVDRQAGAAKVVQIADPVGRNRETGPRSTIRAQRVESLEHQPRIVAVADPHVDAGLAIAQGFDRDASILEGFPGHLQQQTLLGVHLFGFAAADAKHGGVEVGHVIQKRASPRVHLAGSGRLRIVQAVDVPAVGRDFSNRIAPLDQ